MKERWGGKQRMTKKGERDGTACHTWRVYQRRYERKGEIVRMSVRDMARCGRQQ